MSYLSVDWAAEKACKICGKTFVIHNDWAYKAKFGSEHYQYFCSWKCLRKKEKLREEEIANRPRKIRQKCNGEEIMRLLKEGYRNSEICKLLGVASGTVTYYKGRLELEKALEEEKNGKA